VDVRKVQLALRPINTMGRFARKRRSEAGRDPGLSWMSTFVRMRSWRLPHDAPGYAASARTRDLPDNCASLFSSKLQNMMLSSLELGVLPNRSLDAPSVATDGLAPPQTLCYCNGNTCAAGSPGSFFCRGDGISGVT